MFKLKKAEWVCLLFLLYALLRILCSTYPLDWAATRWESFPRIDILSIAIAVGLLKLSRNNRALGIFSIVLLVLTFYGFTEMSDDSFIPIKKMLGMTIVNGITHLRFVILGIFLVSIYFLTKKNQLSFSVTFKKIRILIPFFVIVYLYPFVPLIINTGTHPGVNDQDALLAQIDYKLFFNHDPLLLMQSWITPTLSELMAFAYSLYGPMFALVFGVIYLNDDERGAEEMIYMSTLALAIGYACYTLVPARGPLFTQKFDVSLEIYYMKEFKQLLMDQPRIDRDCFPSLHTALSLITLYSAWKYVRKVFWIVFPFSILVPIACVYLRYHYVIDVLAGIFLVLAIVYFCDEKMKKCEVK